jgi:type I restriction enzyme S subunit
LGIGERCGEDVEGVGNYIVNTYPEHRTSDLEWLGEIPSHWKVSALKRVLAKPLKYGATEAGDDTTPDSPRYIRITDFDNDGSLRDDTFVSLPEEVARDYYLSEGDVLFARSGATVGKTFLFRNYCGPACFAGYLIKASSARYKLTPEFLYYFTKSHAYDAWKDLIFTQATIQNIGADKYAYLPVCLPSVEEQKRIGAYLDVSCTAIDAAVAAKCEQVKTLIIVRETLIESAVTKGIAGAPLRRIDEDWITDIPKHWDVCRIKRVVSQVDYGISESTEQEGQFSVLKMANIQNGEIVFSDIEFVDTVSDHLLLEEGDLLYNRTNSPDKVGKAAIFRGSPKDRITFASYLVRLRTNHRADPYFLNYLVNSSGFLSFARKLAIPSVQQSNLNSTRYCRMLVPLPPRTEQKEIVDSLDTKLAEMNRLVDVIQRQIDSLNAYRKSLIHECVTGQRRITEADVACILGSKEV